MKTNGSDVTGTGTLLRRVWKLGPTTALIAFGLTLSAFPAQAELFPRTVLAEKFGFFT